MKLVWLDGLQWCILFGLFLYQTQLWIISFLDSLSRLLIQRHAGIEWSLDNDASNATVLVASEAHAITLAVEGLLGVVFTIATLTDEAVDVGEVISQLNMSFFSSSSPSNNHKRIKKEKCALLSLGTTSLNLPGVSMILQQNLLGRLLFCALQWLNPCGWPFLILYPLFCQGQLNFL